MRNCMLAGGAAALALTATAMAGVGSNVIINEVDADTPDSDVMEFIELYDGGVGGTALDGLVVVLYNGSDNASYAAFDLDGFSTDAAGYMLLGNAGVPGVDLVFPSNTLQNGADAVAIHIGNAEDFPNDTPVTTDNLIDAIVYDTNDGDDLELLILLNAGQPQVNEGGGPNGSALDSSQRCPNGSGGARNTDTYLANPPSPKADNTCGGPPVGACCFQDGSCLELTAQDCGAQDGSYEGDDTLCIDTICPVIPVGACCNDATGVCTDGQTEADCLASGGRYGGDGSNCMTIDPPCVAAEVNDLLISEIVDGTLPFGQPKWIEITNCDDVTVDLSLYSVGNYNNGSTTLGGGQSTLLSGMLAPGESYIYAYDAAPEPPAISTFEDVYGFPPDQFAGGGFVNGDDAIALFLGLATGDGSDAVLVDVYGEIGLDGTGEVWEYTDGYSYRLVGAGPNPTWNEDEWFFGGANSLEDPGGDDEIERQNLLDFTDPAVHDCGGGEPCPWDFNGNGEVDFQDLLKLLAQWGDCPVGAPCPWDFDGNGMVDFQDLLKLLSQWGPCP